MNYKPRQIILEDRLIGYKSDILREYAKNRYFNYLHHYNLADYSGLLQTTINKVSDRVLKDKEFPKFLNKTQAYSYLNQIDYALDNKCQELVKLYNINYDRPTLYCLVGLPGSGKSHLAGQILANENSRNPDRETVIISSDKIREEYGFNPKSKEDNSKTFNIVYDMMKQALRDGKNVIFDALNINRKSRKYIFNAVKGIDCKKECYVKIKNISMCISDDAKRSCSVGAETIRKQLYKFEIPFYEEGWDNIELSYRDYDVRSIMANKFKESSRESYLDRMTDFDQNNPHHNETLEEHSKTVQKVWDENFKDKYDIDYSDVVLYHDVGKLHTKTTDENGISHFYRHENVGTYLLLENIKYFVDKTITNNTKLYVKDAEDIFLKQLFLVNYHMMPFIWEKDENKLKRDSKYFSKEQIELLQDFNECDRFREKKLELDNDKTIDDFER